MKAVITLLFYLFCLISSGQSDPLKGKIDNFSFQNKLFIPDTIPEVVYTTLATDKNQPAWFINGQLSDPSLIKTIDPKLIDSIYVENGSIEMHNRIYPGQIHLLMKDEYRPKLISLNSLKQKYIRPSVRPTLFIIDNDVIHEDCVKYIVDEKFILKIVVDSVSLNGENTAIDIVKLITKTEENIKRAQEIRIRGNT